MFHYLGAATLSSSDATNSFFNIDYGPLNNLKDTLSAAMGKPSDLLPPPVRERFVTTEGKSVPQLTIDSILDIKVQPGQEVKQILYSSTLIH